MKKKKKTAIAVVTCYIGTLPWYFDYFLHSCRYNSNVDFLIFSDDRSYRKPVPLNVRIIPVTLSELNRIASEKLGFPTAITTGYKLCDFKPAYGVLFSEFLDQYDFWAHSDIDVIFGDIRKFITRSTLDNYDLISVRDDYLSGFFLLFKNTPKMNLLFTLSKDYKKVFGSEKHYCFDETNFTHLQFVAKKPFREIRSEVESMNHVVLKKQEDGYLKAYFDFHVVEGLPGRLKWDRGKLSYQNFEILLYHFYSFKRFYTPERAIRSMPSAFTISRSRIYHKK